MDHLTDRQLGAYLDDELSDLESTRVDRHLQSCPLCREEYDRIRSAARRLSGDLERVGMPDELESAEVWPGEPTAGADVAASHSSGSGTRRVPRALRTGAAALLLLSVAAAGAAAVPGSPLRPLAESLMDRARALIGGSDESSPGFGLEVHPEDDRLEVRIVRPSPETTLIVKVVPDSVGGVWTSGARLRSAPGRIHVVEPGPGPVRVHLPKTAGDARVLSDGDPVAVWSNGELRLRAPIRGSEEEGYRVDLGPEGP